MTTVPPPATAASAAASRMLPKAEEAVAAKTTATSEGATAKTAVTFEATAAAATTTTVLTFEVAATTVRAPYRTENQTHVNFFSSYRYVNTWARQNCEKSILENSWRYILCVELHSVQNSYSTRTSLILNRSLANSPRKRVSE